MFCYRVSTDHDIFILNDPDSRVIITLPGNAPIL